MSAPAGEMPGTKPPADPAAAQRFDPSRTWAWAVVAAYIALTALSWVAPTPSLGRTIVRTVLMSWLGVASVWWIVTIARAPASQQIRQLVTRVVTAVGVCVFLARPMLTGDVWCYAAFARAAATGVNPYTTPLSDALRTEFRVESCGDTPTYGPLWTFGTAPLDAIVAPFGVLVEIAAFKTVMVIGWIAMVMLGARLLRSFDLKTQSVGLAALSVLPISAFGLASEAHNDVVMMALVVYWLSLRAEGSWFSPIPLALSILVKYVTAPLLLLAAVDAWRRGRTREAVCAFALGTVILLAALYFWQNGVLLASLTKYNASWRWLSAPFVIELIVKNLAPFSWVAPAVWLWRGLLILGVGWYVIDWINSPDDARFYRVLSAAALALLLSAEYLWPWYLVWALPFVILAKDDVLTAVAWPLFTVIPIAHVSWAAGRRELGYRAEVVVGLLGLIAFAWALQAYVGFRHRQTPTSKSLA